MGQVDFNLEDTICAPATGPARGGISVIRVSGPRALDALCAVGGAALRGMASHSLRLATLRDGEGLIDEAVVSYYAAPRSYTGEDVVEMSVHASTYIVNRTLQALSACGVRMAAPGEFTQRAFLNGRMDLSRAEAVADLIACENKATHDMALRQLRGGFSNEIEALRAQLLEFVSLVELELDFGEEDVEFASRGRLHQLLDEMEKKVSALRSSFALGNALKEGIPVAIIGKPNAGKSTLINLLLHEERALVSEVPGTTRDTIEEVWQLDGVKIRFIDTAGLRVSDDKVEKMGIARTVEKMRAAQVWFYLFDVGSMQAGEALQEVEKWKKEVTPDTSPRVILIGNKVDLGGDLAALSSDTVPVVYMSAKTGQGLEPLYDALRACVPSIPDEHTVILSNARHYEALGLVQADILKIREGLNGALPGDLLSIDLHAAIDHLGLITGRIITDDILGSIFSRFCIGK